MQCGVDFEIAEIINVSSSEWAVQKGISVSPSRSIASIIHDFWISLCDTWDYENQWLCIALKPCQIF